MYLFRASSIWLQEQDTYLSRVIATRISQGLNVMQFRFVLAMNALCVSSFSNRILDIGYISSHSSLGLVGVKVGTII